MNNNELIEEKYLDMIQDVFLPCDNNHSLNFTGIADSMDIAKSNTKFRKFLNHETKQLSNTHIKKIINYAGYDLMVVPVKRDQKEQELITNIIDDNMIDVVNELIQLKDRFEKTKSVKKEIQKIKNQDTIQASLLSDNIYIPSSVANQNAYDKINDVIKDDIFNESIFDSVQEGSAEDIKNEELFFD